MCSLLLTTRAGTWSVAAVVWAAAVAVAWAALPVAPQAAWPSPGEKHILGFVPGRHTLVTCEVRRLPQNGRSTHGPVRFWDADTGQVIEWLGPDDGVNPYASAFSPDGRWMALHHCRDGRFCLELVDVARGRPGTALPLSRTGSVVKVSFAEDGRRLAYDDGEGIGEVRVWDTAAGRVCWTWETLGRWPALSPDGRTVAWAEEGVPVRLWDVATGSQVREMAGPPPRTYSRLQFSADGRFLVLRSATDTGDEVVCWAADTGAVVFRTACIDAALAGDGTSLMTVEFGAGGEAEVVTRDLSGEERGRVGLVPDFSYRAGWLGADGRTVAVDAPARDVLVDWLAGRGLRWFRRERSTELRLLDTVTAGEVGRLPLEPALPPDNPSAVQVSPDGRLLAVTDDRGVTAWAVPPNRSRLWLMVAAVGLAVPPAAAAGWRVRRLNRFRAAGGA